MTGAPGRLIAFEGIDGSGKTTQARLLAATLGAVSTHEPGATALGQALRTILLGDAGGRGGVSGAGPPPAAAAAPAAPAAPAALVTRAEALLMAADRAQHVTEVVRPALAAGRWVVTDRFSGSTLAYQGYGHGLPVDMLAQLVDWATAGLTADLNVLVDVPLGVARARLTGSPDRLERMDEGFFARVRNGYLQLADESRDHWVVVDGDAPVEAVAAAVAIAVDERLGNPPAPSFETAAPRP